MKDISDEDKLTNIIGIPLSGTGKNIVYVYPNPVKDNMQVQVLSVADGKVDINMYDETGKTVAFIRASVQKGNNMISLTNLADKPEGVYQFVARMGSELFIKRILVIR